MNPWAIIAFAWLLAILILASAVLAIRACIGATKRKRQGGRL